jgi:monofunctional glycosyltransferase
MRPIKFLFKLMVYFVLITLAWVGIYAIVPPPVTATMIMDKNGITKDWTSFSDISPNMVRAVIAAEDGKFCSHDGFDTEAIQKAIKRNAQGGRIRGGSTISQQTAKNAFLWQGGGFFRKGLEAYFTFLIETIWSKKRIMEVYLNLAETGIGTYGVQAGAQRYFKKDAKDLTRIEAARIAAALPLPKKRAVNGASGFTARYGNTIAARINVVRNEGLDGCLYK